MRGAITLPQRKWERERDSPLYTPRYEHPPHRKRSIPKPQALITFVVSSFKGAATSVTTNAFNATGANFLAVICADFGNSGAAGSMSSSPSNTWTALANSNDGGNNNVAIWYAENATVSSTMTVTKTGSFPLIAVMAFAGVATSSSFDQQHQGFQSIVGGTSEGGAISYLIHTTAGAVNPAWTGFSTSAAVTIASFKVAAATGGGFLVQGALLDSGRGLVAN